MLIAIDHGNYAIKTPHHSFVSGCLSTPSSRLWRTKSWNMTGGTGRPAESA